MSEADWERELKEFLKPVKVEWEESLKRVSGEAGLDPGNPIVPAKEWRTMESREILESMEVAIRVLKERKLSNEEKKYASALAKDLVDIAMDPPEDYEEALERELGVEPYG